jgi:hypothetical protein
VNHSGDVNAADYLQSAFRKYEEYSKAMIAVDLTPPDNVGKVREVVTALQLAGLDDATIISAFNNALREMSDLLPRITFQAEVMSPMIEEYGRLAGRRDYQYMVYYDIVDSTGTVAGRTGADLVSYRKRVGQLKQFLNSGFRRVSQDALKAASEVFCWNGDRSSTNDCKHIFIGGTSAGLFLQEVLYLLTKGLEAVPTINLRIYVLPCNFVGTTAYRQEWDTEVSGDRFWEHWSRLLKAGKKHEESIGSSKTFLLVAVEDLIQRLVVPKGWAWSTTKTEALASEIELLVKTTSVKYGAIVRTRT